MSKAKLAIALSTLITLGWAATVHVAAHSFGRKQSTAVTLAPIRFREDRSAGLLVSAWVNGAGPFTFAVDTGAGVTIINRRVVSEAKLRVVRAKRPLVGGLSSNPISSNQETFIGQFALGRINNTVPGKPTVAVVDTLPGSIDGILDPTDAFGNLAYSIDIPNRQLLAFDQKANGLNLNIEPKDGAVVRWLREAGGNRPFVMLGDGRRALIDTGSGFGLAVTNHKTSNHQAQRRKVVSDLGGGQVESREMAPTTISIGSLVLRSVPTDLLTGVRNDTPLILGRRALYPFKITFDPVARLIAFEPNERG